MADNPNLWWSPTLGAILKDPDGSFRVLGGGTTNAWGWFIPAEWPADAERYLPEKTPPDRSGRWVDEQLVPFGPRDLDGWQPTHPEAVAGD
ncbi:hypothetical protein ACFORO_12375 [Amycolatopsis halotolerans]|uniref:Uncharacterized protein n=1 Tax=Amycolatopsis halotolerans TaxID=330083 RepID=A0ABV7QC82_9PSEU